ncbi:hypothetical protein CALCODRAFT_127083 [Calocera cornea HHB12733]|uniref:Uncharacterized protein n=1 Tax=Calocera cornea HHB12733 TaxID=1353952 RepID=A0A165I8F2_9BASI|nr:hypothetical protein CALCODRAFT_127083 [Calocera cornea HHB12733]
MRLSCLPSETGNIWTWVTRIGDREGTLPRGDDVTLSETTVRVPTVYDDGYRKARPAKTGSPSIRLPDMLISSWHLSQAAPGGVPSITGVLLLPNNRGGNSDTETFSPSPISQKRGSNTDGRHSVWDCDIKCRHSLSSPRLTLATRSTASSHRCTVPPTGQRQADMRWRATHRRRDRPAAARSLSGALGKY